VKPEPCVSTQPQPPLRSVSIIHNKSAPRKRKTVGGRGLLKARVRRVSALENINVKNRMLKKEYFFSATSNENYTLLR
jgi:hypothetical protein